jgi:hypothetical protein
MLFAVDTYDDPGWRTVWSPLWLVPIPFLSTALQRRRAVDGITRLRSLYLRMVTVPFLLLVPLLVIWDRALPQRNPWVPAAVAVVGLVDVVALSWVRRRPLPNPKPKQAFEPEQALAGAYFATMMIGISVGNVPQLLGFVGFFTTDRLWSYLIGMGFSFVCWALVAPTKADIERRQLELAERGSTLSLGVALLRYRPPRRAHVQTRGESMAFRRAAILWALVLLLILLGVASGASALGGAFKGTEHATAITIGYLLFGAGCLATAFWIRLRFLRPGRRKKAP